MDYLPVNEEDTLCIVDSVMKTPYQVLPVIAGVLLKHRIQSNHFTSPLAFKPIGCETERKIRGTEGDRSSFFVLPLVGAPLLQHRAPLLDEHIFLSSSLHPSSNKKSVEMVVVAGNGSHQNSPPPTSKSPFKRLLLPCDRTPTSTRVGRGFSATRSSLSSHHRPQQPEDEPASATSACSEIQMEGNLPTDYFLRQNMDEQGWVPATLSTTGSKVSPQGFIPPISPDPDLLHASFSAISIIGSTEEDIRRCFNQSITHEGRLPSPRIGEDDIKETRERERRIGIGRRERELPPSISFLSSSSPLEATAGGLPLLLRVPLEATAFHLFSFVFFSAGSTGGNWIDLPLKAGPWKDGFCYCTYTDAEILIDTKIGGFR
ncbi:hypothetical protein LXL04_038912 [Taraxacum kok-saghyz]